MSAGANHSPAERPLAVVIGISRYLRQQWNLRTAATDAAALAAILERDHDYEVWLRRDGEVTGEALRQLFAEELPTRLRPRRPLLVYFAGHGLAEDTVGDLQGYLVPHNGRDDLASL